MPKQFECDLEPEMRWPRVLFNFGNGWSASIVIRTGDDLLDAMQASVACCPTGHWQDGMTEIGPTEATADEAIAWLAEVAGRAPVEGEES